MNIIKSKVPKISSVSCYPASFVIFIFVQSIYKEYKFVTTVGRLSAPKRESLSIF